MHFIFLTLRLCLAVFTLENTLFVSLSICRGLINFPFSLFCLLARPNRPSSGYLCTYYVILHKFPGFRDHMVVLFPFPSAFPSSLPAHLILSIRHLLSYQSIYKYLFCAYCVLVSSIGTEHRRSL